MIGQNI